MARERPRIKPELRRYHFEGWVHVVSYRAALVYSLILASLIILYLLNMVDWVYLKLSLALYWVILTPLFYFVVKGVLLALSKGVILSSLAEAASDKLREKYRYRYLGFLTLFYILLITWIAGLILFMVRG